MSNSDQGSFYEIQLNTSHLLLVFLGAVVVGVTVFYLGVVIGRGQNGPVGLGEDFSPASPIDSATAGDDELDFYDESAQPAEPEEGAPTGTETATEEPAAASEPDEQPTEQAAPATGDGSESTAVMSAGLPEPDPALAEGWIVQVRSTSVRAEADQLQSVLAEDGYPAFVVSAVIEGTTWYRVRVGRYRSEGEAQRVQEHLAARSDIESTWVTEG